MATLSNKKPKELKPKDPNNMNKYLLWINIIALPIYMTNLILTDEWIVVWMAFIVFSGSNINHAVKSIRKTKITMYYDRYLLENSLYNAFFKNKKIDIPELKNGGSGMRMLWCDNFIKEAMQFYDDKRFNKKAYLEYQLHRENPE